MFQYSELRGRNYLLGPLWRKKGKIFEIKNRELAKRLIMTLANFLLLCCRKEKM
jgi:hypothetical protein